MCHDNSYHVMDILNMLEQKPYKIAKVMNIIEWKLSSLHLDTLNKILRYETIDIDPPYKLKKSKFWKKIPENINN